LVAQGACTSNPQVALSSCMRSCTQCDMPGNIPAFIGGKLLPGDSNDQTSGATVILPYTFPSYTRLMYFTAYFTSNSTVYLQVWRPLNSVNFTLIEVMRVKPVAADYIQTIPVAGCVQVLAGDRIGFTSMMGPAPIAATLDTTQESAGTLSRAGSYDGPFGAFTQSYVFSLNANYQTIPC